MDDVPLRRFILTYQGYGNPPDRVAADLVAHDDLRVIDRTGRMLVVEGPAATVRSVVERLSGWQWSPERRIRQPRTF
jgi:hypothetical protein